MARHPRRQHDAARRTSARVRPWLLLLLLLSTFVAYRPAWHGGMLWDDEGHVTSPVLRSVDGLRRIWVDIGATQQYYPLTHSVFWIEHRLWGDGTTGYHILRIALHACSAFLFAMLLGRCGARGAPIAALVFALHPVHVESVAWISELKNTLSGLFYLAAAYVYLNFDATRARSAHLLAFGLFVLALLGKSTTATLPGALLVVLWWQRGSVGWRRDVVPLLPFFAAGLAMASVTVWVEATLIGARGEDFELSFLERTLVAGRAIWFYAGKLLLPVNLVFNYPRWHVDASALVQYVYPAAAAAVGVIFWRLRTVTRAPLAAYLIFCGTLLPALGFVDVFPFRYSFVADHFQYLASLPLIAAAAGLLTAALDRVRPNAAARRALFAGLALLLGVLTWRQSHQYADVETLYEATIAGNPRSWLALTNLGTSKLETSPEAAAALLRAALVVRPDNTQARVSLGYALQQLGRLDEAEGEYRAAIRLDRTMAEAHNNLCSVLHQTSRPEEAIAACAEALRLAPAYAKAQANMGAALSVMGDRRMSEERYDDAIVFYERALQLSPAAAGVHNRLGGALQRAGRPADALPRFQEAVRLDPAHADARFNLANALQAAGRPAESIPHYEAVIARNPRDVSAHTNLGAALQRLGRVDEAISHYETALRVNPDAREARQNLARARKARGG